MNIQKDDQAQIELRKLIDLKYGSTKQKLVTYLNVYCELDILAMVKQYHFLKMWRIPNLK